MFFKFFFWPVPAADIPKSIYDFKVTALDGSIIDFSQFRGKKILIVNTASKCGFTPQYEALEKLYENNKDHLVIIGFPANNFLFQEPGSNEHIAEFCKKNYGVTFPMATKISVKGKDMAGIQKMWMNGNQDYHFFYKFIFHQAKSITLIIYNSIFL